MAVPAEVPRATQVALGVGSTRASLLREVVRRPAGAFGLIVVALLVLVGAHPGLLAPYGPDEQDIPARLQGPSLGPPARHGRARPRPALARDLRLPHRARRRDPGRAGGTRRRARARRARRLRRRLARQRADRRHGLAAGLSGRDPRAGAALPARPLAAQRRSSSSPSPSRPTTRASAARSYCALKQNQFVEAERSLGATPDSASLLVHVVPNILAPLFILLAMDMPSAITIEAGLSFLGLGVQPPTPSWGAILADGFARVQDSPWGVIAAGPRAHAHHARLHAPRRDAARRLRSAALGRTEDGGGRGDRCSRSTASRSTTTCGSGALRALRDVSFSGRPGEIVGIVGESGCGKTTLASALLRLLPPNGEIRGGSVLFRDRDLRALSARGAAPAARARDRDDLPGSADEPQSDVHGRPPDDRRAARAPSRPTGARCASARWSCSSRSASRTPPSGWTTTRISSRAACASGS